MIRKLETKKELILDSALQLVASKNSFNITIREIAALANVNVAAINYYFKSKAQLFTEMDKHFMENFKDAFTSLDDKTLDSEDRLMNFIKKAIGYASHYSGILVFLRDKINNPDTNNENDSLFVMNMLQRFLQIRELFLEVIKPSDEEADSLFFAFASALVFPFISDVKGIGMQMSENEHYDYIKLILSKFKK